MAARRKTLTMTLTVTVPTWCTVAQARREVKDILNSPNAWYLMTPDGSREGRLRATKVRDLKPTRLA